MRVIYLHGFASGPASNKARFFRDRFREAGDKLEVPDLAEGDFERLTVSRQLQVVERLAGGRPVSLIGSSLGGYLAALYAARHPEVEKLLLMAPAFAFARRWTAELRVGELRNWKETGRRTVYHYADGRERPLGYQFIEDALGYEDYPETTQPALVFHGLHDTVVPCGASEQFAKLRPNVSLRLVNSDHELLSALDTIWQEAHPFLH